MMFVSIFFIADKTHTHFFFTFAGLKKNVFDKHKIKMDSLDACTAMRHLHRAQQLLAFGALGHERHPKRLAAEYKDEAPNEDYPIKVLDDDSIMHIFEKLGCDLEGLKKKQMFTEMFSRSKHRGLRRRFLEDLRKCLGDMNCADLAEIKENLPQLNMITDEVANNNGCVVWKLNLIHEGQAPEEVDVIVEGKLYSKGWLMLDDL